MSTKQSIGSRAGPLLIAAMVVAGLLVGTVGTAAAGSVETGQASGASGVVADAGEDVTADEYETVELNATGSVDTDWHSLNYSWRQVGGPAVELNDADTATPTFTIPDVETNETFRFEVTVSDGTDSDTDVVNVTADAQLEVTSSYVDVERQTGYVNLTYRLEGASAVGTYHKIYPATPADYDGEPGFFPGPTRTDVPGWFNASAPLNGPVDGEGNGLLPGERYVFEVYLSDRTDDDREVIRSWFTTPSGPLGVELSGRTVDESTVALNATVTGFGGTDTVGSFYAYREVGTSNATFVSGPGWDHPDRTKRTEITGLDPGTTYLVTITVNNGDGDTVRKTIEVTTEGQ